MNRWLGLMCVVLGLAHGVSCDRIERRGQLLLFFDTDAPVPLFDRLIVQLYEPTETEPCPECTRKFVVSTTMFKERAVSIGVVMKPNTSGYRLRARLYSSTSTLSSEQEPPPTATIDEMTELPAIAATGIFERTLLLPVSNIGVTRAAADISAGKPQVSLVGTWEGARTIGCSTPPRADEVCVPGGAFWMGNPRMTGPAVSNAVSAFGPADVQRLVVLSPFFIQREEVTVGQYRSASLPPKAASWSGSNAGSAPRDYCTYTSVPGVREQMPLNCILFDGAEEYCAWRGGSLPTEAQYERVATDGKDDVYPWGDVDFGCEDVSFARGGWGIYARYPSRCKPAEPPGGPVLGGSRRLDRVREVVDLAGNLREWSRDVWQRQDESFWSSPGVFVDPVCTTMGIDGDLRSNRGGGFASSARMVAPAWRLADSPKAASAEIGFRCVRPAR